MQQKLKISKQFLSNGMLFCWIEKEILADFIEFWESQKFYFVESVCWVMLDPDRLPGMFRARSPAEIEGREGIDISSALVLKNPTLLSTSREQRGSKEQTK